MSKKIFSVVINKEDPNKFDVSFKYSGSGTNLDGESNLEAFSIEQIFQGETPIENIEISEGAFSLLKIDTLEIPEGLTVIPENCFSSSIIEILKLPSTIRTIGYGAFLFAKIDTLEIPEGVREIPENCFRDSEIKVLKLPSSIETINRKAFEGFQGTIFTDNKESKDRFVKAGLDINKVVNLNSKEECFKALKNKTFQEIRQFEKDFGRDIWDKNYLNTIERGIIIKDRNIRVDLKYSDMTLFDAAKLKKEMLDASKKNIINKLDMFNPPLVNENKDSGKSNKNNPSKGKS